MKVFIEDVELLSLKNYSFKENIISSFNVSSLMSFDTVYGSVQVIGLLAGMYFSILFSHEIFFEKNAVSLSDLLIVESVYAFLLFFKIINRTESYSTVVKEWKEILALLILVIFPVNQLPIKDVIVTGYILLIVLRRTNKMLVLNKKDLVLRLRDLLIVLVASSHLSQYFGLSTLLTLFVIIIFISILNLLSNQEEILILKLENVYLFTALILVGLLKFL
jgi:hypothetical protein